MSIAWILIYDSGGTIAKMKNLWSLDFRRRMFLHSHVIGVFSITALVSIRFKSTLDFRERVRDHHGHRSIRCRASETAGLS